MNGKSIALVALGVAGGYCLTTLFGAGDNSNAPNKGSVEWVPVVQDSKLKLENDELRKQVAAHLSALGTQVSAPPKKVFTSSEEMMAALKDATMRNYTRALQQETDQLIAAGFSMDRIQYLKGRSEQLDTDRRNAEADRRMKGLPPVVDLTYSLDNSDLDLKNEIGEVEYERYRKATGRQISVPVTSVLPGSVAQIVGVKPGDEIIKFGDQRVYNVGQLTKLSEKQVTLGERLTLVVQRNGLAIQFDVPSGVLGVSSPFPPPALSKVFEHSLKAQGIQP